MSDFKLNYFYQFPIWIMWNFFKILLWPYYTMLITVLQKVDFNLAKSSQKDKYLKKLNSKVRVSTRAHLFEVCLESSFQVSL